jgi:hypothetical protein
MEAVRTPETSVYFNEATRRYIPEGYHLPYATCIDHKFLMRDFFLFPS